MVLRSHLVLINYEIPRLNSPYSPFRISIVLISHLNNTVDNLVFTMLFLHALPILAAASFTSAAQVQAVGRWSVSDIQRHMSDDNVTCNWSLNINQLEWSGRVTTCAFTVADHINKACDLVQFSALCPGESGFVVNGGHSGLGFVVLVLYNAVEDAKAYFGANDNALNFHADIPKQEKSAYPASSADKRWLGMEPRNDGDGTSTTHSLMVQNLTRSEL